MTARGFEQPGNSSPIESQASRHLFHFQYDQLEQHDENDQLDENDQYDQLDQDGDEEGVLCHYSNYSIRFSQKLLRIPDSEDPR